jgi:tol-pal system protein YbgF
VASVFIRTLFVISFLLGCIASCASQKDMVHLNKQVNALYRQVKEDKERQEKIVGEFEEILKEHEDAQWELSEAISELEFEGSELEAVIAGQASKQSELEQQLTSVQESQEAARTQLGGALKARSAEQEAALTQLGEAVKARNAEQEARQREKEEAFKISQAEQDEEWRNRLEAVTKDLDSIRTSVAQLQADLFGVKENIQVLTGQIEESNYLIRGVIEKDTTKTDVMVSQINELSLAAEDLSSRLEILENYVSAEIEAKKQRALLEKSSPPKQEGRTETPAPRQRELTESELYDRALGYHRDGRHQESMADFNNFLKLYPKSELADNAQFWIGECYRAQGKYEEAILAYQKVINGYPGGNKVPAAMLHQGLAFEKIDDKTTAELVYKKLVKNFSSTKEAEIAKKRLQGTQ